MIAPGYGPLACVAGVVGGVLAAATIAAFEIADRIDDETAYAEPPLSPAMWLLQQMTPSIQSGRHACLVRLANVRHQPGFCPQPGNSSSATSAIFSG
jgi:hypothetical protein